VTDLTAARYLKPGDILAVRGTALSDRLIQLGEDLEGKPNISNHIAMMHHWDGDVPWGLEGKPGGVGWRDLRDYIAHSHLLLNNCGQPGRTDADRIYVAHAGQLMLGTKYDWEAIDDDALRAFRMPEIWAKDWHGQAPGHVVCSSYAAYLYELKGWAHPSKPDRDTEPADWDDFILSGNYNVPLS
jgi:hypothetical protein